MMILTQLEKFRKVYDSLGKDSDNIIKMLGFVPQPNLPTV